MKTNEFVENLKNKFKDDVEQISELQKLLEQMRPKTQESVYYKFIASSTK